MPEAKIKAANKTATTNLPHLQQPFPSDEQQLPSFFSSDMDTSLVTPSF